ncbi:MAG: hypothetical protein J5W83_07910 [Candidatus Accumulibacter sp.]|uniref:type I-G CRISPR-associated protein, Cas3-extension family n=1 Tax=Accumulibacter sp. TaxID=2053492 RepID=UPI001B094915|nr:hypothetical protein [Accumulibacter sp.]MBO3702454.1 hypothetical protein [Accumulibacter sp.]
MKLTALRPNNPVAVMAAYGALRLLPGARLRWDGPCPELEWKGDVIDHLAGCLQERFKAPEVTLIDDPRKIDGAVGYRQLSKQMPSEWLVAYAAETPEGLRPTGLRLLGGRHQFIANAREIMAALLKEEVRLKLQEGLLGPWRYEDKGLQAWGWDAAARSDAAASAKAVTSAPKSGVLGAYWLAWESLPFWPMVNGRTVGMGRQHWIYPTSAEWLGAHELGALILGAEGLPERETKALGVTLWRAERIGSSDYGGVLGWARPVPARTSSERGNMDKFARMERRKGSIA